MTIELTGTLKVIFAKETVSDNKLDKQNIVVTIDENTDYPQDIIVQAVNKKIETLTSANVKIGDKVIVKCNLKGKENKNKAGFYFNQLDLWNITKAK
jgi:hypothetical protein